MLGSFVVINSHIVDSYFILLTFYFCSLVNIMSVKPIYCDIVIVSTYTNTDSPISSCHVPKNHSIFVRGR